MLVAFAALAALDRLRRTPSCARAEPPPGARLTARRARARRALGARWSRRSCACGSRTAGGRVVSGPRAPRPPRRPRDRGAACARRSPGRSRVSGGCSPQDGHPTGGAFGRGRRGRRRPEVDRGGAVRDDDGPARRCSRGCWRWPAPLGLLGCSCWRRRWWRPAVRAGGIRVPGEGAAPRGGLPRRRRRRRSTRRGRAWWLAWWAARRGAAPSGVLLRRVGAAARPARGAGRARDPARRHALRRRVVACRRRPRGRGVAALVIGRAAGRPAVARPRAGPVALGVGPARRAVGDQLRRPRLDRRRRAPPNVVIDVLHGAGHRGVARRAARPGGRSRSRRRAALADDDRVRLAAAVVVRFSALALTAVARPGGDRRLPGAGRGARSGDLRDTGYGRALLVKLGLFAVLLVGGRLQPDGGAPAPRARRARPRPRRPRRGGGAARERARRAGPGRGAAW